MLGGRWAWEQVMLVGCMAAILKPHQWEGLKFLWESIVMDNQVSTPLFARGSIADSSLQSFEPKLRAAIMALPRTSGTNRHSGMISALTLVAI